MSDVVQVPVVVSRTSMESSRLPRSPVMPPSTQMSVPMTAVPKSSRGVSRPSIADHVG